MSTTVSDVIPTFSTSTPLASTATFTSNVMYLAEYQSISWALAADKTTTVSVQYSSNGTDWDFQEAFVFYATDGEIFKVSYLKQKYVRILITNNDAVNPQTYLRFSCYGVKGLAITQVENFLPTQLHELEIHTTNSAASFTTIFVDVSHYTTFRINIIGDSDGTFILEWSMDGVTESLSESFTLTAATGYFHSDEVKAKYLRIQYDQTVPAGDLDSQLFFRSSAIGPGAFKSASYAGASFRGDHTWTDTFAVIDCTTALVQVYEATTPDWSIATSGIASYTYNGARAMMYSLSGGVQWGALHPNYSFLRLVINGVVISSTQVPSVADRNMVVFGISLISPGDVVSFDVRFSTVNPPAVTDTYFSCSIERVCC